MDSNLLKQNESFVQSVEEHEEWFRALTKGQSPDVFMLACSDSRVSPSIITNAPLGTVFIHRNIANQIDLEDKSFAASLYYALHVLKVKEVAVKGHTNCGGIQAACAGVQDEEIANWLDNVQDAIESKQQEGERDLDELAKHNVLQQVERLKNHPVYQKYGENAHICGYLYHMETGQLEKLTS